MVNPDRDTLDDVVEVDQIQVRLRSYHAGDTPLKTGKVIVTSAVDVIDWATGKAQKAKALGQKYLDALSRCIRLAAVASNHATHIHASIKANIAPGATLITARHNSYSGPPAFRHDPRVVRNIAAYFPHSRIHRAFALLKRRSLGPYHGRRRQHIDACLNGFILQYPHSLYRHVSVETILAQAARRPPMPYWEITARQNRRIDATATRPNSRRRKTASGMHQDSAERPAPAERLPPGTAGSASERSVFVDVG